MGMDLARSIYLKVALSDVYAIDTELAASAWAGLAKAFRRGKPQLIGLWTLKTPLAFGSQAVQAFASRLEAIKAVQPKVCEISDYGIDRQGLAFCTLANIDGHLIHEELHDSLEAERRFTACIRRIADLHAQQILCGDIGPASFLVDRSGEIRFIGPVGWCGAPGQDTPADLLVLMAPEVRSGGTPTAQADVYSLAVLGVYLFSGSWPSGKGQDGVAVVPPLASMGIEAPAWLDGLLVRALSYAPGDRFPDASQMLTYIVEARQNVAVPVAEPAGASEQTGAPTQTAHELRTSDKAEPVAETASEVGVDSGRAAEAVPKRRVTVLRLVCAVLAVFVASLFVANQLVSRTDDKPGDKGPLAVHRGAVEGSEQLRGAIEVMSEERLSMDEKARQLDELVRSDDPLAHDILVRSAVEATSAEFRGLCEKALVDRVRRVGLQRSAEQLRQWLRTVPAEPLPLSYAPLLKSLNTSLPREARDKELREAYATEPKAALRFAAAQALDSSSTAEFQTVISQMVGDALGMREASEHSALALILAHQDLAVIFGDDVVQRRSEIPDQDIVWLLKLLGDRNDFNVRAFANLAVERGVLSPLRRSFLAVVRDREDVPTDVVTALVKAAAGSLAAEEVSAFGHWFDVEAERLLLAVCADSTEPAVLQEAFDVLAGKSLSIQPSATMVDWVRKNYWNSRVDFAKPVGMLANLDLVDPQAVRDAFMIFDRYVKDGRLINLLISANHPVVTRVVLEKYSKMVTLSSLLNMLGSSDREVRMLAIKTLAGEGQLGAAKIIIDHYEREKDDEVKELYRQTFWFIQNRR